MWIAVASQPLSIASASRASESAPPDTAHATVVPGGGKVHRASSAACTSVFAAAFARVLRQGDLLQVAGDRRDRGEHTDNRETDSEPPVKNLCDHAFSVAGRAELADIADIAVSVEVFVETLLDSGQ